MMANERSMALVIRVDIEHDECELCPFERDSTCYARADKRSKAGECYDYGNSVGVSMDCPLRKGPIVVEAQ